MKMILEQMMVIASSQAADKNIAFHVESSVDDSLVVLGDSLRISQIISNLFPMPLNSRKRADRSGSGSGKKKCRTADTGCILKWRIPAAASRRKTWIKFSAL